MTRLRPSRAVATTVVLAAGLLCAAGGCRKAGYDIRHATSSPRRMLSGELAPSLSAEDYDHIEENDFVAVADQPLSTFGADVDTASYSNMRRFLTDGQLPPADAVRIEELVNYFDYAYPEPTGDVAVLGDGGDRRVPRGIRPPPRPHRDPGPTPGGGAGATAQPGVPRRRVGLDDERRQARRCSERGLLLLADELREQDRVAIVAYAGASGLVLPPTHDKRAIRRALERLEAGGSTAGAEGLALAYEARAAQLRHRRDQPGDPGHRR